MFRMTRTAAAAVLLASGLGGIGCTGMSGERVKDDMPPVARGSDPGDCGDEGCGGTARGRREDRPGIDNRTAKFYDHCWPERYSYAARQSVLTPFAMQVNNAAILDQALWNTHFVAGSDTLNPGGLQKLDYLARRRPVVDGRIYLQTSRDVTYDPTAPEKYVAAQAELNEKRAQAILRYMGVQTAARPVNIDVLVIDPADPMLPANLLAGAARGLSSRYMSGISGGFGNLTGTGGGQVAAPALGGGSGGSPTPTLR